MTRTERILTDEFEELRKRDPEWDREARLRRARALVARGVKPGVVVTLFGNELARLAQVEIKAEREKEK